MRNNSSYDALGNMSTRSDVGTYTYGPVNSRPHAVASISGTVNTSFTYDNDGNMLTGNGRTATYTSFDMPAMISKAGANDTFVYGPEHQRVKRQTSTATTIYVNPDNSGGLAYEKDMTSGGATIEERVFVSAGSDPIVMLKRANGTGSFIPYYLHRDNIGSTVAITNSAGALIEQTAYEPLGKRRAPDGASDPTNAITGVNTDRGFTDHEHLDDLALVHMNGRIFDPLVGRFLSADPNVQFKDDLQSYNRYSYVANNPLNTRDPTGYFSLFDGIAAVVGAVYAGPVGGYASYKLEKATSQYLASHQWAYTLASIAVAAATAEYCGGCGSALLSADVSYAQTGSYRAAFKQGAITYAEAETNTVIGDYTSGSPALNVAAHAALGCASAAVEGGKCGAGALSAGLPAGLLPTNYGGEWANGIVQQVVIGGTASVLGGGTFANGAESAAFEYIYNFLRHGRDVNPQQGAKISDIAALDALGTPYAPKGTEFAGANAVLGPDGAADCSGSICVIFGLAGDPYRYSRSDDFAANAAREGFPFRALNPGEALQVGDVVQYPGHLSIYAGDDQVYSAHKTNYPFGQFSITFFGRPTGYYRYQIPTTGN